MSMSIRQHWVPQFYLRGFATSVGGDRLWVTDIEQAYAGGYSATKARVSDVANMCHLYSLPCDDGTFRPDKSNDLGWDDVVDKILQSLETQAGGVWAQLHKSVDKLDLSHGSEARKTLAVFMASMHLRNPRMVAVTKFTLAGLPTPNEKDLEVFFQSLAGMPVDMTPTLEGIADRAPFLAAQLNALPCISAALIDLHWTVQVFRGNKAAGPLVASDTPLFCVDRHTMLPASIAGSDCMVFFPLTSRALLIATRSCSTTPDGAVIERAPESVNSINPFIVHYGQRQAYSGFELGKGFPFLRD